MNYSRRRFFGQCATVVGTSAVSAMIGRTPADAAQSEPLRNWAGNYQYSTTRITSARSLAQIQDFVRKHAHFKVLGTRHCFNGIADSADEFLSLREMTQVALDRTARTVTVESGTSYGQLCPSLDKDGFALHNLASLPHISIAGACATGTHGSGVKNGNLSTAVSAFEIVTASGLVLSIARNKDPAHVSGRGRQSGRPGRGHQGHAGCTAGVHDAAGRVSGPADGASQRSFRRHRLCRLQRQPVHRLAAGTNQ